MTSETHRAAEAVVRRLEASVFCGDNNPAFADSREVAELFGKRHSNVLRDIDTLLGELGEGCTNFVYSSYTSQSNEIRPCVYMNTKGFVLLAMRYRGKNALRVQNVVVNLACRAG